MRRVDEAPMETVHVYVVPEDKLPVQQDYSAIIILTICLLCGMGVLALCLLPSPQHEVSFALTMQGYSLAPVTKTLHVSVPATGIVHVSATTATGTITFYNGEIYPQIIPIGTMVKSVTSIAVVTDEQATIPAAIQTTPPTYGHVTVAAHALLPGASGNIGAREINEACCVTAVLAQNPFAFTGGKGAQSYTSVTTHDVDNAAFPLLTTLEAQTPHLFPSPALSPQCDPIITATPTIGQRAAKVRVSVTIICTAISYHSQSVRNAIQAYSSHFGQGTLSNIGYQVIAVGKNNRITFFVTAIWKPFVARHLWSGK
jgi:hypothetical protein